MQQRTPANDSLRNQDLVRFKQFIWIEAKELARSDTVQGISHFDSCRRNPERFSLLVGHLQNAAHSAANTERVTREPFVIGRCTLESAR